MRSLCVSAAMLAVVLLTLPSHSYEYGPTKAGRTVLNSAGIKSASDIESATFDFYDETYKLTVKANPELLKLFYDRLLCTREDRPDSGPVRGWPTIATISQADGRIVQMRFGRSEVDNHPDKVQLAQGYWVPDMATLFDDMRKDAKAAALDSQLPSFEVDKLEVRMPELDPRDVPVSSPEGKAVIAKAQAIIDWLDLRNAKAEEITGADLATAKDKFGAVTLTTKELVPFNALVIDSTKPPIYSTYPIGRDLRALYFGCDTLIVMDYGNYKPPVVVACDRSGVCYLFRDLRRRNEEREGVEKLGFPGHPVTDTEYYKSPKELYKELQALSRAAYEAVAKKN